MAIFGKQKAPPYDHEKANLGRNLAEAEVRHLEVLRREIANLIIAIDPDLMIRCYDRAAAFEREIESSTRAAAEEAALVAKISMFSEFDLLATHHFVPYQETARSTSEDELIERYYEISRMLLFMKGRSESEAVRRKPSYDDKLRETLVRCMRHERGRRVRREIDTAISRMYAYRRGLEQGDPTSFGLETYEDSEVSITRLPTLGQNEFGIFFKRTVSFAVYSFFVFDDGKVSYSYASSDAHFENRQHLTGSHEAI